MSAMTAAFVALRSAKAAVTGKQQVMTFGESQPFDVDVNICADDSEHDLIGGAYADNGDITAQALVSDFLQKLDKSFHMAVRWNGRALCVTKFVERDGIYTMTISDRVKKK